MRRASVLAVLLLLPLLLPLSASAGGTGPAAVAVALLSDPVYVAGRVQFIPHRRAVGEARGAQKARPRRHRSNRTLSHPVAEALRSTPVNAADAGTPRRP